MGAQWEQLALAKLTEICFWRGFQLRVKSVPTFIWDTRGKELMQGGEYLTMTYILIRLASGLVKNVSRPAKH